MFGYLAVRLIMVPGHSISQPSSVSLHTAWGHSTNYQYSQFTCVVDDQGWGFAINIMEVEKTNKLPTKCVILL